MVAWIQRLLLRMTYGVILCLLIDIGKTFSDLSVQLHYDFS